MLLFGLVDEVHLLVQDLLHLADGGLVSHRLAALFLDLFLQHSDLLFGVFCLVVDYALQLFDLGLVGEGFPSFLFELLLEESDFVLMEVALPRDLLDVLLVLTLLLLDRLIQFPEPPLILGLLLLGNPHNISQLSILPLQGFDFIGGSLLHGHAFSPLYFDLMGQLVEDILVFAGLLFVLGSFV